MNVQNYSEKRMMKRAEIQGIRSSVCPQGEYLVECEKTGHFDRITGLKIIKNFSVLIFIINFIISE